LVDAGLVWGLLQGSLVYPWSGVQFMASEQPLTTVAIALGIWRGSQSMLAANPLGTRALALLLWFELLTFGVTGVDVRSRFLVLLMPLIAVFAGVGIAWLAEIVAAVVSRRATVLGRAAAVTITVGALSAVLVEQASAIIPHRDPTPGAAWWTRWLPPVALSSLTLDRAIVMPTDVIVTNDELAARLVVGRADYWWPPDDNSAERYRFIDRQSGAARGQYGGALLVSDPSAIQGLLAVSSDRAVVVALFNTGKFGFDRSRLQDLIDRSGMVELEDRPGEWLIARFPARR
jgi:hypothetical protein